MSVLEGSKWQQMENYLHKYNVLNKNFPSKTNNFCSFEIKGHRNVDT